MAWSSTPLIGAGDTLWSASKHNEIRSAILERQAHADLYLFGTNTPTTRTMTEAKPITGAGFTCLDGMLDELRTAITYDDGELVKMMFASSGPSNNFRLYTVDSGVSDPEFINLFTDALGPGITDWTKSTTLDPTHPDHMNDLQKVLNKLVWLSGIPSGGINDSGTITGQDESSVSGYATEAGARAAAFAALSVPGSYTAPDPTEMAFGRSYTTTYNGATWSANAMCTTSRLWTFDTSSIGSGNMTVADAYAVFIANNASTPDYYGAADMDFRFYVGPSGSMSQFGGTKNSGSEDATWGTGGYHLWWAQITDTSKVSITSDTCIELRHGASDSDYQADQTNFFEGFQYVGGAGIICWLIIKPDYVYD